MNFKSDENFEVRNMWNYVISGAVKYNIRRKIKRGKKRCNEKNKRYWTNI